VRVGDPQSVARNLEPEADDHSHAGCVRCFLAVPLAGLGLTAAQRLQADFRDRVGDVRWARPETLHLTVHFFGDVADDRAAAALEVVAPIAESTPCFEVILDRLGSFPPHGIPRVLWLGPSGEVTSLTALALECRAALSAASFDVDKRPYNPHCTLGRPRLRWSAGARTAWAAAAMDHADIRFTASRLVLYESRSAPGGAVYTAHASLAFSRG
jgi:2'-5' RNA ligase